MFPSTDRAVLGRSSELHEEEAETAGRFWRGDVEGWREKGVVLRGPQPAHPLLLALCSSGGSGSGSSWPLPHAPGCGQHGSEQEACAVLPPGSLPTTAGHREKR